MFTSENLILIAPKCPVDRAGPLSEALNTMMPGAGIDNLVEVAAFIGQAALETWHFKYFKEIKPRGQPNYFDMYEPGTRRGKNLGNTEPGDGSLFCGRGLGMCTGRANTRAFWEWLMRYYGEWYGNVKFPGDSELIPEDVLVTDLMVKDMDVTVLTAIWYWTERGCGDQAQKMIFGGVPWRRDPVLTDAVTGGFKQVTKNINGGYNHYLHRIIFFFRALQVLGVDMDVDFDDW